jgi:hypothetical protein
MALMVRSNCIKTKAENFNNMGSVRFHAQRKVHTK